MKSWSHNFIYLDQVTKVINKMPKYTLNYFNTAGRGETARLMFALAGVEFTDNLITGEEWAEIKNDSKLLF